MIRSLVTSVAAVAVAACACAPARADGPFSIYGGARIGNEATSIATTSVQTDLGLGYDIGPKTIVPIRARFDLDDAFGNTNERHVGVFGAGVSARLTTPFYLGAGISLDNVNVRTSLEHGARASESATGLGSNVFVGSKLFALPGAGVGVEASYKIVPNVDGASFNSFGAGLRVSL